jgi:hypothetical protein
LPKASPTRWSRSPPEFLGLNRGLVPNGGYTYRVFAGFNVGESDGIDEAITRWALTYAVGAWFVETGSDNADIRFVRAPGSQLPPGAYGGIGYWIYWEDMTVRIVQIRFSDFTGHATGQPGVRRLALHELGHVYGLDDLYDVPVRSSVMVQASGPSDGVGQGAIAEYPTACDVGVASLAYEAY